MRILVVDDAPVERAVLRHVLRELGYEVALEASTAERALALGERAAVDLAIVDGRLPPQGAQDIAGKLAGRGIDVLVVASLAERALVRAAVAAGARGALLRPLLRSQVAAVLEGLARTPAALREEGGDGPSRC